MLVVTTDYKMRTRTLDGGVDDMDDGLSSLMLSACLNFEIFAVITSHNMSRHTGVCVCLYNFDDNSLVGTKRIRRPLGTITRV